MYRDSQLPGPSAGDVSDVQRIFKLIDVYFDVSGDTSPIHRRYNAIQRDTADVSRIYTSADTSPALGPGSCESRYRGSRAIRRAIFNLRLSFLANYIQTMLKFGLNYY